MLFFNNILILYAQNIECCHILGCEGVPSAPSATQATPVPPATSATPVTSFPPATPATPAPPPTPGVMQKYQMFIFFTRGQAAVL